MAGRHFLLKQCVQNGQAARITAGKINKVINCCEILPECEQNPHVSQGIPIHIQEKSTSFCCSPQFLCARAWSLSRSLMWRASGFTHNKLCLSRALRDMNPRRASNEAHHFSQPGAHVLRRAHFQFRFVERIFVTC